MKRILFGILFVSICFSFNLSSQEKYSKQILESVWNKEYKVNVIPDGALSGSYDFLEYPYVLREDIQSGIVYTLEISWESAAIGGRYIMEITPLQILLYSQHDNTKANYLYWVTNLESGEFSIIKKHLIKLAAKESDILPGIVSGKLEFVYDWLFTDTELRTDKVIGVRDHTIYEKMYAQIVKDHLYFNAFVLVKEINECLKNRYISFPEKEAFFQTRIIRLISDKSDVN